MPDLWVIAGHVLIPLTFGLIPGLLPAGVSLHVRWASWLMLVAAGTTYVAWLQGGPDPFHWLGLASFTLSSLLSLYVLVAESRRRRVRR